MQISYTEYLNPENGEINEEAFLQVLRTYAQRGDFVSIEREISGIYERH
jgi:hypothetical protein